MHPRIFSKGDRFGRLTIVEPYSEKYGSKWKHTVLCECGTRKIVRGSSLSKGHSNSCGCLQREISTRHGMYGSPEYVSWCAMMTRTTNEKQENYKNYGARGISVCDEWKEFESFFRDMGEKPSTSHSIERVDNDKGYSKENCTWADRSTQNQNQRLRRDNKTGHKGVYYRASNRKYCARIQRDGVDRHLGSFDTLSEAIKARQQAESTGVIRHG